MAETLVLSEDEALELVAFLVTAASLLPQEPTDYGPMRLVNAAQRLCVFAAPRASSETTVLLRQLAEEITPQARRSRRTPEAFVAFLKEKSLTIARLLARREGREV